MAEGQPHKTWTETAMIQFISFAMSWVVEYVYSWIHCFTRVSSYLRSSSAFWLSGWFASKPNIPISSQRHSTWCFNALSSLPWDSKLKTQALPQREWYRESVWTVPTAACKSTKTNDTLNTSPHIVPTQVAKRFGTHQRTMKKRSSLQWLKFV